MTLSTSKRLTTRSSAPLLLALMLAACGGGTDSSPATVGVPADVSAPPASPPGSPAGTVTAASSCGLPNFQRELQERINAARNGGRLCGSQSYPPVPPLAWDARLFEAASGHAADMARNDYFSHTSQDGRSFSQRVTDAGYQWSAVGENIAAGQINVEQVMNGWLDSPGHCRNLMSADFVDVGVACVREESSTYRQYWAMSLGRPR